MNSLELTRKEQLENWIPTAKIGKVLDVANTVAFMASNLTDYINGANIYIDCAYMNHNPV